MSEVKVKQCTLTVYFTLIMWTWLWCWLWGQLLHINYILDVNHTDKTLVSNMVAKQHTLTIYLMSITQTGLWCPTWRPDSIHWPSTWHQLHRQHFDVQRGGQTAYTDHLLDISYTDETLVSNMEAKQHTLTIYLTSVTQTRLWCPAWRPNSMHWPSTWHQLHRQDFDVQHRGQTAHIDHVLDVNYTDKSLKSKMEARQYTLTIYLMSVTQIRFWIQHGGQTVYTDHLLAQRVPHSCPEHQCRR